MRAGQSPPTSFLEFSSWFHQDIYYEYPTFDAAVTAYIATLDSAGVAELRAYLGELVQSDASDDELRKLWSDSGAQWSMQPIRPYFERIRAQLAISTTQ